MAVYVGRWDCTSCGYKGVLGPKTECSNCGADRPKNVTFYMADDKDIVQDPELLKQARSGADWACSYCGENNQSTVTTCKSCGNGRNAAKGDENLAVKEYDTRNVPRSGDGTREKKTAQPVAKTLPKINKKKVGIVLAVIFLILFILSRSKEITVSVDQFEWERTIKVEQYLLVEEEGWSVPSGGTQLSSFQAVHHHNRILDHYETRTRTKQRSVGTEEYVCGKRDLGNGYFEDKYCTRTLYESYEESYEEPVYRQEPVYQTKYRYSIYRWKPTKSELTSGANHEAEWADTKHIEANENLREAGRSGIYTIIVRDEKKETHRHKIEERIWHKLEIGSTLKAKRGAATGRYRGLDEKALKQM